jgi:NO-binding membrane sensor protein with MHYT domain
VLAILEACLAATAALFVFFRYRSHWEDSFIKRGLSSLVLAAAVLGMHHIGLAGTSWTFRADKASALDMLHGRRAQSIRLTIGQSQLRL